MLFILSDNKSKDSKIERLYEKYKNLMFYVANNILHDEFLAEDAVHQTFVKIYDSLHKVNENDCRKTRNFLVIVCRNISINMYNQRKKRSEDAYDEKIINVNNESTEALIISNESFEHLNEIIRKLKPIYQEVIFLRYSHGFSIDEISEILKANPKTIQKRIERGKKQLLGLLNKEGELNG